MKSSLQQTSDLQAPQQKHSGLNHLSYLSAKFRRTLLRWHRWIGLVSAIFVLLLASTGLMLNHTSTFKLDQTFLSSKLSQLIYGIEFSEPLSYGLDENRFVQLEGGLVYKNRQRVAGCVGRLVGVSSLGQQFVFACSETLVVLTEAGEVLESLGASYGIPSPIESIGRCETAVCILSDGQIYEIDFEELGWQPINIQDIDWSLPSKMSPDEIDFYTSEQNNKSISLERWILDLHSGRVGGSIGVLVVDLMAILFIFSAISGLIIWFLGSRRNRS